MGQYFYIVNLDRAEYLHPHSFGCGLKFGEFTSTNVMFEALAYLTSDGLGVTDEYCGRWAGDRIITAGDYGEKRVRLAPCPNLDPDTNAHIAMDEYGVNISDEVIKAYAEYDNYSRCARCAGIRLSGSAWGRLKTGGL